MAEKEFVVDRADRVSGTAVTSQTLPATLNDGGKILNRSGSVRITAIGSGSPSGSITVKQQKANVDGQKRDCVIPSAKLAAGLKAVVGPFDDRYNDGDGYLHLEFLTTLAGITLEVVEDAAP